MDCACPDSLVQCTLAAPPRGWLINYGPNPNPGRACLFPDTKETSKPLPRRPSFSPSFRMEPIIVISGDHDVMTTRHISLCSTNPRSTSRSTRGSTTLCNYGFRTLSNAETEGWSKVPKALMALALGRAMIAVSGGEEPGGMELHRHGAIGSLAQLELHRDQRTQQGLRRRRRER